MGVGGHGPAWGPGEVAGLVSLASLLLSGECLARQMGEAGKELVRQRFSINAMVEGNLRVYRKVLGLPPDPDSRRG